MLQQELLMKLISLTPAGGDISIEWVWRPQVYESVRIGSRATSIYPYKARPIAYNRNGKLPYNGIAELCLVLEDLVL